MSPRAVTSAPASPTRWAAGTRGAGRHPHQPAGQRAGCLAQPTDTEAERAAAEAITTPARRASAAPPAEQAYPTLSYFSEAARGGGSAGARGGVHLHGADPVQDDDQLVRRVAAHQVDALPARPDVQPEEQAHAGGVEALHLLQPQHQHLR